ncbi:MAG TPA: putative Ig domain-containing protein [Steroidobacteraceae bacterium]|nr:putative Ig domain-containing protein [Steroidobacteraceae bacterium]
MSSAFSRSALVVRGLTVCALAVAALAGCGGGGSSSNAVVQSAPVPPTISGTPPTQVTAGQAYSFTPSASGPSGTTLSFSVQNLPSWATFSIASGNVSGTPSSANVGSFSNIVISVSDGQMSAALPAFNIQVNAAQGGSSGSATLSWVAPTTNTNGTPLTDLAGFIVKYGTSPSALNQSVTVPSATATGYTVQNLAAGTWYFTVIVYTTEGAESAPSDVASKTVS